VLGLKGDNQIRGYGKGVEGPQGRIHAEYFKRPPRSANILKAPKYGVKGRARAENQDRPVPKIEVPYGTPPGKQGKVAHRVSRVKAAQAYQGSRVAPVNGNIPHQGPDQFIIAWGVKLPAPAKAERLHPAETPVSPLGTYIGAEDKGIPGVYEPHPGMLKNRSVHFGPGKGQEFFVGFNTEQGGVTAHVFKYEGKPIPQKRGKTHIEASTCQVGFGGNAFGLGYGIKNGKEGFTPVAY
jgi:hypothetical protein